MTTLTRADKRVIATKRAFVVETNEGQFIGWKWRKTNFGWFFKGVPVNEWGVALRSASPTWRAYGDGRWQPCRVLMTAKTARAVT